MFTKVHIEISNICNLKCSFCPEVERPAGRMDLVLFEKILGQLAPMTKMVCLHLMGEPLGHPDLASMVSLCQSYGLRIFFVTNGILLRSLQKELLLDPAFFQVNFSMHSFFSNFPDRDPSNYLSHIFDFTDRAFEERPDLYINYRLWNLEEIYGQNPRNKELLRLISDRYDSTLVDQCMSRGMPALSGEQKTSGRIQKALKIKNRLYLHFDSEFTWPDLSLPFLGREGTCYGLDSHFGILVDGTVVPCCLDKEGVISLGNLKEAELEEILQGPRALQLREGFRRRQLLEPLCQRCNYVQRFR